MFNNQMTRTIAVAVSSFAALVGCERKDSGTTASNDASKQSEVSHAKNQFLSTPRDLPEAGFLLYADSSGKQGRLVFDYARSTAGMVKHEEFDLVGRVQATRGAGAPLWEPLLPVNSDRLVVVKDSPEGIRDVLDVWPDPIVGRPQAYSQLSKLHPGIEITDRAPWEKLK